MPKPVLWMVPAVVVLAAIGAVFVAGAGRGEPSSSSAAAQPDKTYDELIAEALRIVAVEQGVAASDLEIHAWAVANYPESGKRSFDVKVWNPRTQETRIVELELTGNRVSAEELAAQERAAHVARYGKLDPDLADAVAGASSGESFHVLVWVVQPPYVDPSPDPLIGSAEAKGGPKASNLTRAEIEAQERERLDYHTARASALVAPLLAQLHSRGIEAEELQTMGAILLVATADLIRELNAHPLVDSIGLQAVADDDTE